MYIHVPSTARLLARKGPLRVTPLTIVVILSRVLTPTVLCTPSPTPHTPPTTRPAEQMWSSLHLTRTHSHTHTDTHLSRSNLLFCQTSSRSSSFCVFPQETRTPAPVYTCEHTYMYIHTCNNACKRRDSNTLYNHVYHQTFASQYHTYSILCHCTLCEHLLQYYNTHKPTAHVVLYNTYTLSLHRYREVYSIYGPCLGPCIYLRQVCWVHGVGRDPHTSRWSHCTGEAYTLTPLTDVTYT